ncbi:MAG: transcription antitermination protein NusB [Erysipelotrichaceae bacterium]|nr:transcription antitermination protein NusB [Erysipelotrichaceae bacterium]
MNRHETREQIVFALYQHLLLQKELRSAFENTFGEEIDDEYVLQVMLDLELHEQDYIAEISPLLKKWTFDRLNLVDQAILLDAVSEYRLGIANRNIVIDEALNIAHTYSDEEAYKYINGVLDRL